MWCVFVEGDGLPCATFGSKEDAEEWVVMAEKDACGPLHVVERNPFAELEQQLTAALARAERAETEKNAALGTWQLAQAMLTAANARLLDVEAQLAAVTAERDALNATMARMDAKFAEMEAGSLDSDWRCAEAEAQAAELRAALEHVEWVRHDNDGVFTWEQCPVCDAMQEDGHADDCELAAALSTPAGRVGAAAIALSDEFSAFFSRHGSGRHPFSALDGMTALTTKLFAYRQAKGEVSP